VKIRGYLVGHDLSGNHDAILQLPVTLIHRILLVNLNQRTLIVVDFLPESHR